MLTGMNFDPGSEIGPGSKSFANLTAHRDIEPSDQGDECSQSKPGGKHLPFMLFKMEKVNEQFFSDQLNIFKKDMEHMERDANDIIPEKKIRTASVQMTYFCRDRVTESGA